MNEQLRAFWRHVNARKQLRYIISGVASEIIEYATFFVFLLCFNQLVIANSISLLGWFCLHFTYHCGHRQITYQNKKHVFWMCKP